MLDAIEDNCLKFIVKILISNGHLVVCLFVHLKISLRISWYLNIYNSTFMTSCRGRGGGGDALMSVEVTSWHRQLNGEP